jgi:hypothetical protein
MSDIQRPQPGGETDYAIEASPSPLYEGEIIEGEFIESSTDDASITGIISFRARGRFAVSFDHAAISANTKVFASITELGTTGNPILGLADTKIYNIVPTPGRVTIRGEALWDNDITLRMNLVIF